MIEEFYGSLSVRVLLDVGTFKQSNCLKKQRHLYARSGTFATAVVT